MAEVIDYIVKAHECGLVVKKVEGTISEAAKKARGAEAFINAKKLETCYRALAFWEVREDLKTEGPKLRERVRTSGRFGSEKTADAAVDLARSIAAVMKEGSIDEKGLLAICEAAENEKAFRQELLGVPDPAAEARRILTNAAAAAAKVLGTDAKAAKAMAACVKAGIKRTEEKNAAKAAKKN